MSSAPRKWDDLEVLVPLRKLLALMESAEKVEALESQVDQLRRQFMALRGQFLELMDKFAELE